MRWMRENKKTIEKGCWQKRSISFSFSVGFLDVDADGLFIFFNIGRKNG